MRPRAHVLMSLVALLLGVAGCSGTGSYVDEPYYDSGQDWGGAYYHDELAPYGTWVHVSSYGRAWCPNSMPVEWRPYTVGHWAYTDWGWMWLSDDPWGAAPYHYGRWAYDAFYGWVWVPGDIWAPAWVAWRYGDGWVGWAPLPPEVPWRAGYGLEFTSFDLDRRIRTHVWTFTRDRDFVRPDVRTRIASANRNPTLVELTRNVTTYVEVDSRPVERGFGPELIRRRVAGSIPTYRIVEKRTTAEKPTAVIRGRTIEVVRPPVRVERKIAARPPATTPAREVGGQPAREEARDRGQVARTQGREREQATRVETREREEAARMQARESAREEAERKRLEARLHRERAELARQQERERRSPPPGTSAENLRRRHQEEMRAQEEMERRDREVHRNRQKQLREKSQEPREEKGRERAEPQGRGRQPGREL